MKEKGVEKCPHCGGKNFESISMRTHVCREKKCGKRFGDGWHEEYIYDNNFKHR